MGPVPALVCHGAPAHSHCRRAPPLTGKNHAMHPYIARLFATGWALVILHTGALCALAGGGDVPLGPGSPAAEGRSDALLDSAPAVLPGERLGEAATSPRQHALADPTLAATAAKRTQLRYLVRCALPADVTLYADV